MVRLRIFLDKFSTTPDTSLPDSGESESVVALAAALVTGKAGPGLTEYSEGTTPLRTAPWYTCAA